MYELNPSFTTLSLSTHKILEPELPVGLEEMGALISIIAVHTVRVDHEIELLSFPVEGIEELKGILVVDIVVAGAVGQFEHDRFYRFLDSLCSLEMTIGTIVNG